MTALAAWLGEIDRALATAAPAGDDGEQQLDALLEAGLRLLTDGGPPAAGDVDPAILARVQRRLRTAADQVRTDLDATRAERQAISRAGRAHAGYAAVGP